MNKRLPHYIDPDTVFEKKLQKRVCKICKQVGRKELFIDVGAHVGHWVNHTGRKFKHTLAIEASPENWDKLKENVFIPSVEIVNKAVYSKKGTVGIKKHHSLSKDPYYAGMRCYINNTAGEYLVSADTLENIYSDSTFSDKKISLIKMDIEGFELVVILNSMDLIKKHMPVMILEIEQRWLGRSTKHLKIKKTTVDEFRKLIIDIGYNAYTIPKFSMDTLFVPKGVKFNVKGVKKI